jgi:hypothetical protein
MIYYVDVKASRDRNGLKETPFRRINDMARVAAAGDEVHAISQALDAIFLDDIAAWFRHDGYALC